MVPDRNGTLSDVVLGCKDLADYEKKSPYFGALIGRVGNRIAKGTFTVDGATYHVPINNGPNSLHGGLIGYDKRVWDAEPTDSPTGPSLKLSLVDPDGDQGYPGTVHASVTYTLTPENTLRIQYVATSDKATPINLTNHTYFNLKDAGKTDVLGHEVRLFADHYLPVDDTLIPTGEVATVHGTPIDFTQPKPIGRDLQAMGGTPVGYDHCVVIDHADGTLREAAQVYEPTTGRLVSVYTTQPGLQFYTGNFLDGTVVGKGGFPYQQHASFCLETQHYPDSVNHPSFPDSLLRPGQTYQQTTEYRFTAPATKPW